MLADLEVAAQLVREAGALAERMRREGVAAQRKTSVSDLVTAADRAAEELIVGRLRSARPGDGLVGEEGSASPTGDDGRTWYVDPIDGTYNYAWHLPVWCSALALAVDDFAMLGAVYHPVADELWTGGREDAASRNGVHLPRLPDRPLTESSLATYLHPGTLPDPTVRRPLARAVRCAATVRTFGSGSVELAWVAAGRLGGYLQHHCLPWDWYPGAALVDAAGGATRLVHLDGHRWHLAGNHRLVDDLERALLS